MDLQFVFDPQPPIVRDIFSPILQYRTSNSTWFEILKIFNDSIERNFTTTNLNVTLTFPAGNAKSVVMRYIVGITEFLVFAIGSPANFLVLYLTYEIFRRRARSTSGDSGGNRFQNGQLFVLTMTAFDLLFCLIHAPMMFTMLLLINYHPLSFTGCIVMYFVTHTTTTGSSLSLLALNVEKFIQLYKPLHYRSIITRRRTLVACALIWIISISWGIFLMFGPFMINGQTPKGQCYQQLKHHGVYVYFAAQFFVLPTLVSLAISGFTLLAALKTRKRRTPAGAKRSGDLGAKSRDTKNLLQVVQTTNGCRKVLVETGRGKFKTENVLQNTESRLRMNQKQGQHPKTKCLSLIAFAGFVFTTTIWTCATTLPYRITFLWRITHPSSECDAVICTFVLFALLILNAAGNPFITIMTKRQYSRRVGRLLFGGNESDEFWTRSSVRRSDISTGSSAGAGNRMRKSQ